MSAVTEKIAAEVFEGLDRLLVEGLKLSPDFHPDFFEKRQRLLYKFREALDTIEYRSGADIKLKLLEKLRDELDPTWRSREARQ